jgi:(R,R)-butanediol dehydrogenase / meso-butanediol dehydrogenase / diacetyl reductase
VRAAVIAGDGKFEIADVPEPTIGSGDLLLRVSGCGVCGSDMKARHMMPVGTIMGHEFSGEVVAVGGEVTGWSEGAHVAVLPVIPCGHCAWCQSGYLIHCSKAQIIGLGGVSGGFAEYAVVNPLATFALPASLPPVQGALVEPFAVGLHCINTADVSAGDDILVIGAGSVGLTSIAWAKVKGARRITAIDPAATRLAVASEFGATDAFDSLDAVEPNSYDAVIECVGKPGLLDRAVAALRPRATAVVAGVCIEPDSLVSLVALMKEASIRFAVYYTPAEFRTVIEAFESGQVDPLALLSQTNDLGQINEVFEDFPSSPSGAKVILRP